MLGRQFQSQGVTQHAIGPAMGIEASDKCD